MEANQERCILDNLNAKSIKEIAQDLNTPVPSAFYFALLGMIFIFALIIRLYPVIQSPETYRKGLGPFGDSYLYHVTAYNLYKGHGFSGVDDGQAFGLKDENKDLKYTPENKKAPAYPFFISMVYRFFGSVQDMKSVDNWHKNFDKVRIAQCIVDSFICLLVFFIVRVIYSKSYWPAFISAILYCFSFYNIYYTRALLSESVTTFMVTLSILLSVLSLKRNKLYLSVLSGISMGICALSRAEYILFPLVFIIYIFFIDRRNLASAIKKSAALILAVFITIAPWTIRNLIFFKEPIAVSTGALGYNLYLGTIETNTNWRDWKHLPDSVFVTDAERAKVGAMSDSRDISMKEFDDFFMSLALNRIRRYPAACLKTWITRIPRLWYQNYVPMYVYPEASGNFFLFYFVFALYAIFRSARDERILMGPICLLFIYLTLIFLPLHIEPRYSVSSMPAIICATAIGIFKIIYWKKS